MTMLPPDLAGNKQIIDILKDIWYFPSIMNLSEKLLHISTDCLSTRIKTILNRTFQGSNFSFIFYIEVKYNILFQLASISKIIYLLMTISNYNSHEVNRKISNIVTRIKTNF